MLKKFSGWVGSISLGLVLLFNSSGVAASTDPVAANGLGFLQAKQQANGSIGSGYSNPSQWSAIAFAAYGTKAVDVKNTDVSLYDFLLTDSAVSTATDIEARILAIHAAGGDATNFGGVNYVQNLENLYSANQLGDPALLNDDMFGLISLIAVGDSASDIIKQDVLNFIIAHQAPSGAFSYCSDYTAQWCDPSADLTGAALQSLKTAKNDGMTSVGLDNAITMALSYLQSNQNPDGGFGYFGSSDADSTAWVLMALNLNDPGGIMQTNAKNWLVSSQQPDGGFPSFSGSDSTTTAHALIALSGNGWLVQSPLSVEPGSPVVGGKGGVVSTTSSALVASQEQVAELRPVSSVDVTAQTSSQAQNAAKDLVNNVKTAGKLDAAASTNASSFVTRWRWVFLAVAGASLLGASIYFVSYNKGKK